MPGDENATLLARDRILCFAKNVLQVSRLIRSSRIQRCPSFSERVGPRVVFLKASQVIIIIIIIIIIQFL